MAWATAGELGDLLVRIGGQGATPLRSLLCWAAFFAPVGSAAFAADDAQRTDTLPTVTKPTPAPAPSNEGEIVITGSRIPRPNLTAVSPVAVLTSKDVKLQGAVLTETLINSLPQAVPDQGMFLSNGATGTATVDLRGFGASRTLVLINGRRLLPGDANYPAPDINFVPSSLISRVEVLTGGASSVYGSDAVAGVVNFIMDTHLQGLRLDGQASVYQHNNRNEDIRPILEDGGYTFPTGNVVDGGIQDINAAYGTSFADGRGHVTAYAGYRQSSGFTQDSRDYSSCAVSADDPIAPPECGGSTASAEGSFAIRLKRYHLAEGQIFAPGNSFFNFAPYNFYQRPDHRYTAGLFADFEVNDWLKPYFEGMFMDDRTVAQIAPSGAFSVNAQVACNDPLLSAQQLRIVCTDGNFVGQQLVVDDDGNIIGIEGDPTVFHDPVTGQPVFKGKIRVSRRNVEGGARVDDYHHRDVRLLGGVKGDVASGLSYDLSYLFGQVKQDQTHTNDLLTSRITGALDVVADANGKPVCVSALSGEDPDCVPWDIFTLGAVTPEAAAYLAETTHLTGMVKEQVVNGNLTAELGTWGITSPWAEQAPGLNAGFELRKDELSLNPDEHFQNADVVGLGTPLLPLSGTTSVKELFAEARVPLITHRFIDNLTLEGGYRLSWYKNGESKLSSSSWKVGVDLSLVRGLRFRASNQRAVRAPNVQELFSLTFADNFRSDPCAGFSPKATLEQCEASGVTAAQYGQIEIQPDNGIGYNGISGGNVGLEPETATTKAIGVVLEPRFLRGFSATVDWFDITLEGAIGFIGSQTIINTCVDTGDPIFCGRVHRDSEGSLWLSPQGFVDNTEANIGALKTNGIDIGSTYTHSLGAIGSANFEFQGTWNHHFIIDNGGLSTPFDCAGLYGNVCGFPLPRWRHNLRATWLSRNGFSLSLMWRHIGSVPVDADLFAEQPDGIYNPVAARIPAQNYFDLTAIAQLNDRFQFRLGVRNLFDREPPIVATGQFGPCSGSGTCNGNTYPQLYDPAGRFIFAGATINLF